MFIEYRTGPGAKPIRVKVVEVVAYRDDGTAISLCSLYGPCEFVSQVTEGEEFTNALLTLGIKQNVEVGTVVLPAPPPGAAVFKQ